MVHITPVSRLTRNVNVLSPVCEGKEGLNVILILLFLDVATRVSAAEQTQTVPWENTQPSFCYWLKMWGNYSMNSAICLCTKLLHLRGGKKESPVEVKVVESLLKAWCLFLFSLRHKGWRIVSLTSELLSWRLLLLLLLSEVHSENMSMQWNLGMTAGSDGVQTEIKHKLTLKME